MQRPSPKFYSFAIRSIPFLCVAGFVTAILGAVVARHWVVRLGMCLFFSGFAVWGLANGCGFLWLFIRTVRKQGFQFVVAHPWSSFFHILFMAFLLCVGFMFLWLVLRPPFGFFK